MTECDEMGWSPVVDRWGLTALTATTLQARARCQPEVSSQRCQSLRQSLELRARMQLRVQWQIQRAVAR